MDSGGDVTDAARALADVDAIRRRVVNVVGHSLRTPVTTMAGMAAALESAEDEDTRAMLIDGLARNARRVEQLLDDLLVAAGVGTALPVGEPAPTAVEPLVQGVWRALDGPGSVTMEDAAGRDPVIRAESFERILLVLLDNALKYGDGRVTAKTTSSAEGLRVEIVSSGSMPSDDELEHACELLYRGEHAVTMTPGLGIGLAVARQLARAEGGDVTLSRRDGDVVAALDLPG